MTEHGLDLVVFPAAGDVGRVDLFTRPESLEAASRNGVVYSTGNRVIRHLGIPTVTVPMGFMGDIQMPVGLTFAGAAYSDDRLLDHASAFEAATRRRQPAFLTPTLPSNQIEVREAGEAGVAGETDARRGPVAGDAAPVPEVSVADDGPIVTYWMNKLQSLDAPRPFLVTLNASDRIDPQTIIAEMEYRHPVYDLASGRARVQLPQLNTPVTAFAGAYHGWGFHEDGCRSGVEAAAALGVSW
jgi:hypothetical protein